MPDAAINMTERFVFAGDVPIPLLFAAGIILALLFIGLMVWERRRSGVLLMTLLSQMPDTQGAFFIIPYRSGIFSGTNIFSGPPLERFQK